LGAILRNFNAILFGPSPNDRLTSIHVNRDGKDRFSGCRQLAEDDILLRSPRATADRAYHFFAFPSRPRFWTDLTAFDGICALNAASPAGVMQYVQPNILSCLRCSQPFVSMLTIVDGPAGYKFAAGSQFLPTKD
jgi:hypothetical protein